MVNIPISLFLKKERSNFKSLWDNQQKEIKSGQSNHSINNYSHAYMWSIILQKSASNCSSKESKALNTSKEDKVCENYHGFVSVTWQHLTVLTTF